MDAQSSISNLLTRLHAGDEHAARAVFERYSRQLAGLAERHLSAKLAGRIDGEDIVQSVFRTFFARTERGEFRIDSSVDLWQLLVTITITKARQQGRFHTFGKRDVNAEFHPSGEQWIAEAVSGEPSPAEAASLVDQMETLLDGLPQACSEILTLSLEGYTRTEIAEELSVSRQTVYRTLNLLKDRALDLWQ